VAGKPLSIKILAHSLTLTLIFADFKSNMTIPGAVRPVMQGEKELIKRKEPTLYLLLTLIS